MTNLTTRDMDPEFSKLINQLPGLLEDLITSPLVERSNLGSLPEKGVYVFYEDKRPIYVGRTNRMRDRIREHGQPSGTSYTATFAFRLAKEKAETKDVDLKKLNKQLEKDPVFDNLYSKEKDRVSHMSVRTVEITKQDLQTLFEIYAIIGLGTTKYNDFDTH